MQYQQLYGSFKNGLEQCPQDLMASIDRGESSLDNTCQYSFVQSDKSVISILEEIDNTPEVKLKLAVKN